MRILVFMAIIAASTTLLIFIIIPIIRAMGRGVKEEELSTTKQGEE